jgi:general secretion pathway protein H
MGNRGYTLLEILVVLVILGVLSGFVVLNLRGNNPADLLEQDARRLSSLIRSQCEDALLSGRSTGVHINEQGFRFEVVFEHGWRSHPDPLFRPRSWSVPLHARLDVDGRPAHASDEPQVLCLLSGELTPFELDLTIPGIAVQHLSGTADGRVERTQR